MFTQVFIRLLTRNRLDIFFKHNVFVTGRFCYELWYPSSTASYKLTSPSRSQLLKVSMPKFLANSFTGVLLCDFGPKAC